MMDWVFEALGRDCICGRSGILVPVVNGQVDAHEIMRLLADLDTRASGMVATWLAELIENGGLIAGIPNISVADLLVEAARKTDLKWRLVHMARQVGARVEDQLADCCVGMSDLKWQVCIDAELPGADKYARSVLLNRYSHGLFFNLRSTTFFL